MIPTEKNIKDRKRKNNVSETRETQRHFQEFLNHIEDDNDRNGTLTKEISEDLNTLDLHFGVVLDRLKSKQHQDETKKLLDTDFTLFKQQRVFKRQFVNHLIDRISDKRDLLTKYSRFLQREEFLNNTKNNCS